MISWVSWEAQATPRMAVAVPLFARPTDAGSQARPLRAHAAVYHGRGWEQHHLRLGITPPCTLGPITQGMREVPTPRGCHRLERGPRDGKEASSLFPVRAYFGACVLCGLHEHANLRRDCLGGIGSPVPGHVEPSQALACSRYPVQSTRAREEVTDTICWCASATISFRGRGGSSTWRARTLCACKARGRYRYASAPCTHSTLYRIRETETIHGENIVCQGCFVLPFGGSCAGKARGAISTEARG